ncbi:hypothetical protein [Luteibacter yeojuensis]|uniref:Uncharacterized protein n=1 Tax=Luteibacter yeojuensis TaxID=345309 RepID=A0A7X5QU62_9GAMM|nr:hypothetical protein [Luteibacter yeojuensis]NID15419.1 hypothetical protein [Luteibacter yeojuensis]
MARLSLNAGAQSLVEHANQPTTFLLLHAAGYPGNEGSAERVGAIAVGLARHSALEPASV